MIRCLAAAACFSSSAMVKGIGFFFYNGTVGLARRWYLRNNALEFASEQEQLGDEMDEMVPISLSIGDAKLNF